MSYNVLIKILTVTINNFLPSFEFDPELFGIPIVWSRADKMTHLLRQSIPRPIFALSQHFGTVYQIYRAASIWIDEHQMEWCLKYAEYGRTSQCNSNNVSLVATTCGLAWSRMTLRQFATIWEYFFFMIWLKRYNCCNDLLLLFAQVITSHSKALLLDFIRWSGELYNREYCILLWISIVGQDQPTTFCV